MAETLSAGEICHRVVVVDEAQPPRRVEHAMSTEVATARESAALAGLLATMRRKGLRRERRVRR